MDLLPGKSGDRNSMECTNSSNGFACFRSIFPAGNGAISRNRRVSIERPLWSRSHVRMEDKTVIYWKRSCDRKDTGNNVHSFARLSSYNRGTRIINVRARFVLELELCWYFSIIQSRRGIFILTELCKQRVFLSTRTARCYIYNTTRDARRINVSRYVL